MCQWNNPQHVKTGEGAPLTIKRILREPPLRTNRRLQFFGFANKTMKQVLNDGDTTYGDTLHI